MNIIDSNLNMLINTNAYDENKIKQTAQNANNKEDDKSLMKACQDFEAIFVHMLLKSMRSTVEDSGLIEKSTAREIFEDMQDQELASHLSKESNGIGIAKMLYEQMKRNY